MNETFFVCIGTNRVGWGHTPRAAVKHFWTQAWRIALSAAPLRPVAMTWLDRECVALVSEYDPVNWHRALKARGMR